MADQKAATDWTGIVFGILSVVVTLVAGFGVFWLSKRGNRKSLTYSPTEAKIAYMKKDFTGTLKIMFNGREVKDASLVSIIVKNSGSQPIRSSDFEENLSFRFEGASKILGSQITDVIPKGLRVDAVEGYLPAIPGVPEITIRPLLLNDGDQFTLVAVIEGYQGKVEPAGRVVGIRLIEKAKEQKNAYSVYKTVAEFMFWPVLGLLIMSSDFSSRKFWFYFGIEVAAWAAGAVIASVAFPTLYRWKRTGQS